MGQAFHIVPFCKRGDKRRGCNQRTGRAGDVLSSNYEHCGLRCDFPYWVLSKGDSACSVQCPTFSPPLSHLTLEGSPNLPTAERKYPCTVLDILFVLHPKETIVLEKLSMPPWMTNRHLKIQNK